MPLYTVVEVVGGRLHPTADRCFILEVNYWQLYLKYCNVSCIHCKLFIHITEHITLEVYIYIKKNLLVIFNL